MRDHKEVVQSILQKTEEYEVKAAERRRRRKIILSSVVLAAAACVLGVVVWKIVGGSRIAKTPAAPTGTVQSSVTPGQNENTPRPTEIVPTGEPTAEPTSGPTEVPPTPTIEPLVLDGSKDLTKASSSTSAIKTKEMDDVMRTAYETFAYKLFAEIPKEGTRMISPFSIYTALGMLANGADGETLAQINEMLGLTEEERNAYLAAWIADLTKSVDGRTSMTNADSIWIRDGLESYVPKLFLDTCANYYRTAVFSTPMGEPTRLDINAWVSNKTKNMITEFLEEAPDAEMILLNAIAFEEEWENSFEGIEKDFSFEKENGDVVKVDMLSGTMKNAYFSNELLEGFVKPFRGGEFYYVALLPKKYGFIEGDYVKLNLTLDQVAELLRPGLIRELMDSVSEWECTIMLPKYEKEYAITLNEALQALGMTDAFSGKADLTRLLECGVMVKTVFHKTYISVDLAGAKAAAATEVGMWKSLPQELIFDRPFIYMIVDSDGLPIFMGTFEG